METNFFTSELTGFENYYSKINSENINERIWEKDFTLWSKDKEEIENRLGWLDISQRMVDEVGEINSFVDEVKADGYLNCILIGMGGSSLAPEVFANTFGIKHGFLNLTILDSTHPNSVKKIENEIDYSKTLFIISTKSGGTVETISGMKYFYNRCMDEVGNTASEHFTAITDPGSALQNIGRELNFRKVFLNDPNIGGRFSALSMFGMVPAALIGVNILEFLNLASGEILDLSDINPDYLPSRIGAFVSYFAEKGKDKLTFYSSEKLQYFGAWIEQLIAESTGKKGKGILPIVDEPTNFYEYGNSDRIYIINKFKDDHQFQSIIDELTKRDIPLIVHEFENEMEMAKDFYIWEFATAVMGYYLNIHPFNQPNVETTKIAGRKIVNEFTSSGKLTELDSAFENENYRIISDSGKSFSSLQNALVSFTEQFYSRQNPYLSFQIYSAYQKSFSDKLNEFRNKISRKFKMASTVGIGPRYLHSTGQLHKGDAGNGFFIQLVDMKFDDVKIPDELRHPESALSFGVLCNAQSMGEREALISEGRKILRIECLNGIEIVLNELNSALD